MASKNKDAEPGGWAFEFRNDFYPDVDDTAFVLMALQRVKFPDAKRMEAATRRGVQWLLSMQNRDGGWEHSIATTIVASSAIFLLPITTP